MSNERDYTCPDCGWTPQRGDTLNFLHRTESDTNGDYLDVFKCSHCQCIVRVERNSDKNPED